MDVSCSSVIVNKLYKKTKLKNVLLLVCRPCLDH